MNAHRRRLPRPGRILVTQRFDAFIAERPEIGPMNAMLTAQGYRLHRARSYRASNGLFTLSLVWRSQERGSITVRAVFRVTAQQLQAALQPA